MTIKFDARRLPPADRAEAVREKVAEFVPLELGFDPERGPASAYGAITDLGQLTICSLRSNAVLAQRTPKLASDDVNPSIVVGLQMTGESLVMQGGREATLRPGDLVLYDSTAPYVLADQQGLRQHKFRIPLDQLALPHDVIRQVCAVTLSPGHPVADLASTYLQRLAMRPELFGPVNAEAVSQPSIELIRAVITTHIDAADLSMEPFQSTLHLRIMEYVRAHLRDPDLSAGQIASEHHISVRQLYKVLARNGVSLGDWIRTRRLEQCRREIGTSRYSLTPIASIAHRWGFRDASSFARIFRAEYGVSPREWRDLHGQTHL